MFWNIYDLVMAYEDAANRQTHLFFYGGKRCTVTRRMEPWLDRICLYQGSSLQGRRASARQVLHIRQRPPVMVSLLGDCVLFSIYDTARSGDVWINRRYIHSVTANKNGCEIVFADGSNYQATVGKRCIVKHMRRCDQYYAIVSSPLHSDQWLR